MHALFSIVDSRTQSLCNLGPQSHAISPGQASPIALHYKPSPSSPPPFFFTRRSNHLVCVPRMLVCILPFFIPGWDPICISSWNDAGSAETKCASPSPFLYCTKGQDLELRRVLYRLFKLFVKDGIRSLIHPRPRVHACDAFRFGVYAEAIFPPFLGHFISRHFRIQSPPVSYTIGSRSSSPRIVVCLSQSVF